MSWKGYAFCLVMALIAVVSALRPVSVAHAATVPTYHLLSADINNLEGVLNDAAQHGWTYRGSFCRPEGTNAPCEVVIVLGK